MWTDWRFCKEDSKERFFKKEKILLSFFKSCPVIFANTPAHFYLFELFQQTRARYRGSASPERFSNLTFPVLQLSKPKTKSEHIIFLIKYYTQTRFCVQIVAFDRFVHVAATITVCSSSLCLKRHVSNHKNKIWRVCAQKPKI